MSAGPLYGGMRPTTSDDASLLPSSEHIVRVDLSLGEEIIDVDVGFSFNVVTNIEGADATSPQGSLRQFISNANTATGPNAMHFVPVVATNATDGIGAVLSSGEGVHGIRVAPGINRATTPGELREDGRLARPTAVSGLAIQRSDSFGTEYRGDVFIPDAG